MDILIWVNTLALLFALVAGGIIINVQLRKIAEALARVEETAARSVETMSRMERLSLAILERLTPPGEPQA
jgi:hypothetical protein